MHRFKSLLSTVILFFLILSPVFAHEYKKGDLFIFHPTVPQPAKGAPVSAGYVEIHNNGSEDDVLLGVKSSFSGKSQIHTMVVVDDIARMRPVKDGVVIPAGEIVRFEQGGLHFMFMEMTETLKKDQKKDAILTFKKAGDVKVEMLITEPVHAHKDHEDHSNHN